MAFWGVEVKPGQTVRCETGFHHFIQISQAVLGESQGGSDDAARIYVQVDGNVVGVLSADKFPQVHLDLRFKLTEFELSHTSKTASVFFSGYKAIRFK